MHVLFLTSTPPARLEDGELQNHIQRLLLTLDSIRLEMADSWNHPDRQNVMPRLRQQLAETTSNLDAALYVWSYRMITMR